MFSTHFLSRKVPATCHYDSHKWEKPIFQFFGEGDPQMAQEREKCSTSFSFVLFGFLKFHYRHIIDLPRRLVVLFLGLLLALLLQHKDDDPPSLPYIPWKHPSTSKALHRLVTADATAFSFPSSDRRNFFLQNMYFLQQVRSNG
jgi:hypothetical protein